MNIDPVSNFSGPNEELLKNFEEAAKIAEEAARMPEIASDDNLTANETPTKDLTSEINTLSLKKLTELAKAKVQDPNSVKKFTKDNLITGLKNKIKEKDAQSKLKKIKSIFYSLVFVQKRRSTRIKEARILLFSLKSPIEKPYVYKDLSESIEVEQRTEEVQAEEKTREEVSEKKVQAESLELQRTKQQSINAYMGIKNELQKLIGSANISSGDFLNLAQKLDELSIKTIYKLRTGNEAKGKPIFGDESVRNLYNKVNKLSEMVRDIAILPPTGENYKKSINDLIDFMRVERNRI